MSDLEPSEVEDRRAARERALELLYEAEVKGLEVDEVLAALPVAPVELAVELVRGVAAHRARIDAIVARRVAPRWALARLAALDRAILRLGTYELAERPDRSQAVVINEAVVLARRFGTDDSPRFVNGVLSAVAAEVRGPGDGAAPAAGVDEGPAPTVDALDVDEGPAPAVDALVVDEGPAPAVDALVVDLDGVIRHWDPDALPAADRQLGLPAGTIAAAAFEPGRLRAAMVGDITFEDWCAEMGEEVAAAHPIDAAAVAKAFEETGWTIDDDVLDLVAEARRRVPVGLLSNASTRVVDDVAAAGLSDRFDAVVGSADIGVAKPDAGAFVAVAERLGVPVDRCLFVDDLPDNVAGARAAGMRAELFTGAADLAALLADVHLVPPAP